MALAKPALWIERRSRSRECVALLDTLVIEIFVRSSGPRVARPIRLEGRLRDLCDLRGQIVFVSFVAGVDYDGPLMNPVPIHARNPGPITGDGNWTWLLRGRVPTLIDAGTGEPGFLDALDRALEEERLVQVLVTHGHVDHASGAPALAERHPGVRFRKMPWPERDRNWDVGWEPIDDGDVIEAGDSSLEAVYTPGHAPDHLCFWHAASRLLFCADLAVLGSSIFIPATFGGDLAAYLASLERVRALRPSRMLPAHGAVIEEPDTLIDGYIAHRRQREEQVIDALRRGDRTPDDILARVYTHIEPHLRKLAGESVLAHLLKLEHDGRARRDGDAWHIIDP
jgi:glyoxylase-like metal-dependent hydrolase (beta-lactamase superfamily II)